MHYIKGSYYIWQTDSYDKIKKCGICINNCIDGYSKKNAWCEVTSSRSFFHLALLQDILSLKKTQNPQVPKSLAQPWSRE